MPRPTFLSGATSVLKIDGVDVKDYGMIVNRVNNPSPVPKPSRVEMPEQHGDVSIPTKYGSRQIQLTGAISGDTHANLLTNIDALRQLFRLHASGKKLDLIFQDNTSYTWKVIIQSFTIAHKSRWFGDFDADFSITLHASLPFAEANVVTSSSGICPGRKMIKITDSGNAPTPLSIEIIPKNTANILHSISETTAPWTTNNCSLSIVADEVYGTYIVRMTQTAPGAYFVFKDYAPGDIMSTGKYYAVSAYCSSGRLRVHFSGDNGADNKFGSYNTNNILGRSFVKIDGTSFFGGPPATVATIFIEENNTGATADFDGVSMVEITAAEYADDDFLPPPYTEDSGNPVYNSGPRVAVTGKNLCPQGARDIGYDGWIVAPDTKALIFDSEVDKPVLSLNIQTTAGHAAPLYLETGEYAISYKYKARGEGGSGDFIVQTATETSIYESKPGFGNLYSAAMTFDNTWHTVTSTFTINDEIPYGKVVVSRAGGALTLHLTEIQIEKAGAATTYEEYRSKSFYLNAVFPESDKIIIDGNHKSAINFDHSEGIIVNAIQYFNGQFLELLPGTNWVVLDDRARIGIIPEAQGSWFDYVLKYRVRYL